MRHSLAVAATSAGIATELSPGHYQFTDVTTAAVQRFYVVRLRWFRIPIPFISVIPVVDSDGHLAASPVELFYDEWDASSTRLWEPLGPEW